MIKVGLAISERLALKALDPTLPSECLQNHTSSKTHERVLQKNTLQSTRAC